MAHKDRAQDVRLVVETLTIIEVQVGEYVGEDDIVRLEDDWDRER